MNAQQFKNTLFLSFEIADASTMQIFSLWGLNQSEIKATTHEARQLADLFYQLDGGDNFFNCCLFLATNGAKISDIATIESAPIEFPEHYPAEMPAQWDFDGWTNALFSALDSEGKAALLTGIDGYFSEYHGGKTSFELANANGYEKLPIGSFLTTGDQFVKIVQQNGGTTWVFGGIDCFAFAGNNATLINPENLPSEIAAKLNAAWAKYEDKNQENRAAYEIWAEKEAVRTEKRAAKETARTEKAAQREATKTTKAATKAAEIETAKTQSANLKTAFFQLDANDIEALKAFMLENQKTMLKEDRTDCTEFYKLCKMASDKAAKEAKEAEKAAEKAAKEAEKAAPIEEIVSGTVTVEVAAKGTPQNRKRPTQTAEISAELEKAENLEMAG